jgi:hypothetical protein
MWMISSAYSAQLTWQQGVATCNVVGATPITQPNEAITLSGQPSNYINYGIEKININGVYLAYFPTGVFKIFPNLIAVTMNNCYSTTLVQNAFANCKNLVSIQITNGNIPDIPAGIAQTCFKVLGMYLAQNNIVTVDKNAFIGLNDLKYLDMRNNKITCLSNDMFQNTPFLESINFDNNKITALSQGLFRYLLHLRIVEFKSNMITTLPYLEIVATGTTYGFAFYFDSNQITSIDPILCKIITSRNRMDNIYFFNNPCVKSGVYFINRDNCQPIASSYQTCMLNWTPLTNSPLPAPLQC